MILLHNQKKEGAREHKIAFPRYKTMYSLKVKLADVVFLLNVNYVETVFFFSDFVCQEPENETVSITTGDLEQYQKAYPQFTQQMCEKAALKYKIDRFLVSYRTFPLHASALCYRGSAYVFTALSGVGKSTHARLWKEAFQNEVVMINDDRPYIKLEKTGVFAYSHPQSGKHNIYTNTSGPVRVIGKIVRDSTNYVKRISKSEFFPVLVQQTFTLDEPVLTAKIITYIKEVLNQVDVFEIHCCISDQTAFEINAQLSAALNSDG